MNGITVPDSVKHLMKKEYNAQSPEYTEAIIRDYIKAHTGVIKQQEFVDATNVTTAPTYIKRLMVKGYINRFRVKNGQRGHQYRYEWNEVPRVMIPETEEVIIRQTDLKLPTYILEKPEIDKLSAAIFDYSMQLTGEELKGVVKFRNWLLEHSEKTKLERERILNEHTNGQ